MSTDALRDQIAAIIAQFFAETDSPEDAADALLPLIAARERAAAARALNDAADALEIDPSVFAESVSVARWLRLRARAVSQAAPPEEKP